MLPKVAPINQALSDRHNMSRGENRMANSQYKMY